MASRRRTTKRADPKATGSAFSSQIAAQRQASKNRAKSLQAPKRAALYTEESNKKLKAGKLPKPTYISKTKTARTRQYQFYGPGALRTAEELLKIEAENPRFSLSSVEFSTGYRQFDERIGTSWSSPAITIRKARYAAERPSAKKIFSPSEDEDEDMFESEDDEYPSSAKRQGVSTRGVFVDVYIKTNVQPKGTKLYEGKKK